MIAVQMGYEDGVNFRRRKTGPLQLHLRTLAAVAQNKPVFLLNHQRGQSAGQRRRCCARPKKNEVHLIRHNIGFFAGASVQMDTFSMGLEPFQGMDQFRRSSG